MCWFKLLIKVRILCIIPVFSPQLHSAVQTKRRVPSNSPMHLRFVHVFYRPVYVGPYSEDSIARFSCSGPRLVVQWWAAAFMRDVILLEVQVDVIGGYRSFAVASDGKFADIITIPSTLIQCS
jgi:hypothetical protein